MTFNDRKYMAAGPSDGTAPRPSPMVEFLSAWLEAQPWQRDVVFAQMRGSAGNDPDTCDQEEPQARAG